MIQDHSTYIRVRFQLEGIGAVFKAQWRRVIEVSTGRGDWVRSSDRG